MNAKLLDAVSIFKTLGWDEVTSENILQLPTGTAEQKKLALAGLKSGEWGEFAEIKKNTYGWRSFIDADQGKLALFAVRMGVNAQRAANILKSTGDEMLVAVIAERGSKYASDFIGYACVSRRRMYEHSASVFGSVAVRLVDRLGLDIPQNVDYMKDWSVYAAAAMGLKAETRYRETDLPGADLIKKRFMEHISMGVAVNTPATGPFGAVLPAGVKCGWLSREKALELTFAALDASVRPGDRKVWLGVLDALDIDDVELAGHMQALIPLLAAGDPAVIERLAPVLIAQADDELFSEVLSAAFSAPTKKAKQLVLKSALSRPCPKYPEELSPWLSILAGNKDKTIAALVSQLSRHWGIDNQESAIEVSQIQGLWQDTPPVWQVPSFEMGEASPEALTELAAKLVAQPAMIHDVAAERFLAVANAVAYESPEAARLSLRGLRFGKAMLDDVLYWVKGEKPSYGFDKNEKVIQPPLRARDYIVGLHLGQLPCLLSTPSTVDLSIRVTDLTDRLKHYKQTGTDVLEADLLLAMTRLDHKTKTLETAKMLQNLDIPVVLQSGEKMSETAGTAVLQYLGDPMKEPLLNVSEYSRWGRVNLSVPDSLRGFPKRFDGYYLSEAFSIFPHWGDIALRAVGWDSEVYREQGLNLRQIARRAVPLPDGASINFLAAQRSVTPDAAEDSALAVKEVWERGLLQPGVTDTAMLDWCSSPPTNLAALSLALDGIAHNGLLSVVWPILDELVVESLKAPRLIVGTAEIAELILELLPEVQNAVKNGKADSKVLQLPGIRALAQRSGSSRAVSAAGKIVSHLPSAPVVSEKTEKTPAVMEPPFNQVWPTQQEVPALLDDGVVITVDWVDSSVSAPLFLFTLKLPDISDRVFQVVKNWYYDLEREGQCQAYEISSDIADSTEDKDKNEVWLHWDTEQKDLVVCKHRNWAQGNDGPLKNTDIPPLSSSLLTVIIGLLAQDGDAKYYAPRLLETLIKEGVIGEEIVRQATKTLIQSPVVSPSKLVRVLEQDIRLLPVLWPMLTECIKHAGVLVKSGGKPPVWVNRILDIALRYAPYLAKAAESALIPEEDAKWAGLAEIASSAAKSTAVKKAKMLLQALDMESYSKE